MSAYRSIAQVMASLTNGSSPHRTARVLRFVHRHPDSHARIIGQLRRNQQRRQRRATKRFRAMQRAA